MPKTSHFHIMFQGLLMCTIYFRCPEDSAKRWSPHPDLSYFGRCLQHCADRTVGRISIFKMELVVYKAKVGTSYIHFVKNISLRFRNCVQNQLRTFGIATLKQENPKPEKRKRRLQREPIFTQVLTAGEHHRRKRNMI